MIGYGDGDGYGDGNGYDDGDGYGDGGIGGSGLHSFIPNSLIKDSKIPYQLYFSNFT